MAGTSAKSLRCTQSGLYEIVVQLDPDLNSTVRHIENLRNGQVPERATITGALLLLNETYDNLTQLFEDTILKLKELWSGKKLTNLYSYLWIAKNFQVATWKWKAPINKGEKLEEYRDRLLSRAQFLGYIAAKFQELVLRNLEADNERMQSETLDTNRLRESLRKGQRYIALDLLNDYKRYVSVAIRSLNTLFKDSLIYRDGYQCVWGYYASCEMCLIIRAELTNYAGYYNGKALNGAVAEIDPKKVGSWYLSLPKFQMALNHLKKLNPEFNELKRNYDFKILNLKNGKELEVEFRKLSLWCKSLLLRHRLDLIEAFVETKNSLSMNSVEFNAAYNLYETALEFFWQAKAAINRRTSVEELTLDRFMSLIDHIHVFGFSLAVAIHLLQKFTAFRVPGSVANVKIPTRLSTSTNSVNINNNLPHWYYNREPAVILKSAADKAKIASMTPPNPIPKQHVQIKPKLPAKTAPNQSKATVSKQAVQSIVKQKAKSIAKQSNATVPKHPMKIRPQQLKNTTVSKQPLKSKTKPQSTTTVQKPPGKTTPTKRTRSNSSETSKSAKSSHTSNSSSSAKKAKSSDSSNSPIMTRSVTKNKTFVTKYRAAN